MPMQSLRSAIRREKSASYIPFLYKRLHCLHTAEEETRDKVSFEARKILLVRGFLFDRRQLEMQLAVSSVLLLHHAFFLRRDT